MTAGMVMTAVSVVVITAVSVVVMTAVSVMVMTAFLVMVMAAVSVVMTAVSVVMTPPRADAVCTGCGTVLESGIIVSDVQVGRWVHVKYM